MDGNVRLVRYWPANQQRSIHLVINTKNSDREKQLLSLSLSEYNLKKDWDSTNSSLNAHSDSAATSELVTNIQSSCAGDRKRQGTP